MQANAPKKTRYNEKYCIYISLSNPFLYSKLKILFCYYNYCYPRNENKNRKPNKL